MLAPLDLLPQRHAVAPATVHVGAELAAAKLRQLLEWHVARCCLEHALHGENRTGSHVPVDPSIQQEPLKAGRSAERRQVDAHGPLDEGAKLGIEQPVPAVQHQADLGCDHGIARASGNRVGAQQPTGDRLHDRRVQDVQSDLGEGMRPDLTLRGSTDGEGARREQLLRRLRCARADAEEGPRKLGVLDAEIEMAGVLGSPPIAAEADQELMVRGIRGVVEDRARARGPVQGGAPQIGANQRELEAGELLARGYWIQVVRPSLRRGGSRHHRVAGSSRRPGVSRLLGMGPSVSQHYSAEENDEALADDGHVPFEVLHP